MFLECSQNDSKELFLIIVSKLADERSYFDLFSIKIVKRFICGGHEAGSPEENSSFLVVPTKKTKHLEEYIESLRQTTRFEGNNALFCDKCNALRDMVVETKSIETSASILSGLFNSNFHHTRKHKN